MTQTAIGPITFDPNRIQKGEYRIYLNLNALSTDAFTVLKLAETMGFSPEFVGCRDTSYAILFREFHAYEDDPDILFGHLDEKTSKLWHACEPDAHLKLSISNRFAKRLEVAA